MRREGSRGNRGGTRKGGQGGGKQRRHPGPDLGLGRRIPRRDFLQGTLIGAASLLTGEWLSGPPAWGAGAGPLQAAQAPQDVPGYYPPALTGMRGSAPGTFETAHALRDGSAMPPVQDSGERYDLVVVGAGISGLSAAHFWRARHPHARILILDNHDDFGGHARRNEFTLDGRMQLLNGGTLLIDSPRPYGRVAAGLLTQLGIDVERLIRETQDFEFYRKRGFGEGVFFDRETFGADRLIAGIGEHPLAELLKGAPLSERARADVVRIEEGTEDYLPGLTVEQKKDRLSRMSYRDYLLKLVKADPAAVALYQTRSHGEWGVGIDAVSALDCFGIGLPGFKGLKLTGGSIPRMGPTPSGYLDTGGSPRLHFPDGNATIARLLVRDLIPAAIPGHDARDVVTARADYSQLDRTQAPVRLRLSSTAIAVRHADAARRAVEVTYVRDGRAFRVGASACVLAGYNMMIPYLCPELPEPQKAALHAGVKVPLVYTSVALRNWQPFAKLGVARIVAPGSYHSYMWLNWHVDIGSYRSVNDPAEPILLHMVRTPCQPGLIEKEQNKAGRAELLATPFSIFERNIRDQLARTLGPAGFDAARDITAITVNRWPHGYAHEYNPLFDPDVPESQRACVIGRARFGRIAIANSDAGGEAYTDCAIDQAHRAVQELLEA